MAQSIQRIGDLCTGHDCYPPRVSVGGSANVFINGIGVVRMGDPWETHCCPGGGCHAAVQETGSATVFANGLPVARTGDNVSCGSVNQVGSPDVTSG